MKKKKILAITLASLMLTGCLTACDLTETDSEKDMAQTVAEVDISESEDFDEGGDFEAYKDVIQEMSISKRELVAYFVNSGSSYISNGYSYEDTFDMLVDSMVNYRIIVQYTMVYFFETSNSESEYYNENYAGLYTVEGYESYVGDAEDDELLLKTLTYFLDNEADESNVFEDENGDSYTRYDKAVYELRQSVNSAIDSQESSYIATTASGSATSEDEDRATPDGVETVDEDYYDPDYGIYTGLNTVASCGTYEKLDGSSTKTRTMAYNAFLSVLSSNYLIDADSEEYQSAAAGDIEGTDYYSSELLTTLQSALQEKLSDYFEDVAEDSLTSTYLYQRYTELLGTQTALFDDDSSSFSSGVENVSDSSFLLYSPEGATEDDQTRYGFVYNILLPFTTQQSYKLSEIENRGYTDEQYYTERVSLLNEVYGSDQRSSWFNGSTDYSFKASLAGIDDYYETGSDYLFFENTMTKSSGDYAQYEGFEKYYGYYPYNGEVSYDAEEGMYDLTPEKLTLSEFITEMEGYMNWALDREGYTNTAAGLEGELEFNSKKFSLSAGYVSDDTYMNQILDEDGEVDYSNFVYYVGQVSGLADEFDANTVLADGSAGYTAMSAFNELQFAYSTDTGCLNTYYGYSVAKESTEYVGEFEYAAKLAVAQGVGTYTVCPSDYGWHIIYCTYTFDEGVVYDVDENSWTDTDGSGVIDEDDFTENTFEYFFYLYIRDNLTSTYESVLEARITNVYNNDDCVTIYEARYSDYTSLDNKTVSGSSGSTSSDDDDE